MTEFSKSQKKIVRELVQLGLRRECKSFTDEIARCAKSSEWETRDPHELYCELYQKVTSFDKHIERRYDSARDPYDFMTLVSLFRDGVLTTDDIARLDPEVQSELVRVKDLI